MRYVPLELNKVGPRKADTSGVNQTWHPLGIPNFEKSIT
jgi:hypothetical protein